MKISTFSSIIAGGALLVGCGGSPETENTAPKTYEMSEYAHEGVNAFVDQFGCLVNDIRIQIIPAKEMDETSKDVTETKSEGAFRVAFAEDNRISVRDDIPPAMVRNFLIHESFHVCTDQTKIKYFDNPYVYPSGTRIVGTQGFIVHFNDSTIDKQDVNSLVEEGVADWVATGVEKYIPSNTPLYTALRQLTSELSAIRGFTKEDVVKWQQNDDIVYFIAKLKNKLPAEVDRDDFTDILNLYTDSARSGIIPDRPTIETILSR